MAHLLIIKRISQLGWLLLAIVCVLPAFSNGEESEYCLAETPCWPSDGRVGEFMYSLSGGYTDVHYIDLASYYLVKYVKNWDYWTWPSLVVICRTPEDVQKSVRFAKKYGIKMSMLSSGHDYIGRSTGYMTVMIRMNDMNDMTVFTEDANSDTGSSMIAETGANWENVYEEVDKHDLIAVGGAAHTVAMGGWFLGGGHSAVSRKLGLGVDQIMSYRMVLADGQFANISAEGVTYENGTVSTDTDLFWALRGGGGGSFGVVTSFHFRLHPKPLNGLIGYTADYPYFLENGTDVGSLVLDNWGRFLKNNMTENWGGYVMIQKYNSISENKTTKGQVVFYLIHYGGDFAEAVNTLKPLVDFMPDARLKEVEWKNYTSFWDYNKLNADDLASATYIVNRLIQPADLEGSEGNLSPMAQFFKGEFDAYPDLPDDRFIHCTATHIGKKTSLPAADATAVNPAFRTALLSLSCGNGGWVNITGHIDTPMKVHLKGVMRDFAKELYTIGEGVYLNEPDSELTDWKTDYWGNNYGRLLEAKRKYDPERYFTCLHCVGSDLPYTGTDGTDDSTSLSSTPCVWVLLAYTACYFCRK
ncbi:unnamed protein product [Owenia fusiformis]|nr:unnamed protein product [Owenia fusiformis]